MGVAKHIPQGNALDRGGVSRTNKDLVIVAGRRVPPENLPKVVRTVSIRRIATNNNFARTAALGSRRNVDVTQADTGTVDGVLPERCIAGHRRNESLRFDVRLAFRGVNHGINGTLHRFDFLTAVVDAAAFRIANGPSKLIYRRLPPVSGMRGANHAN